MDEHLSSPLGDRLPLARARVDRDDVHRGEPDLIEHLFISPKTRLLLQNRDTTLVAPTPTGDLALDLREPARLALRPASSTLVPLYLGRTLTDRTNPDGRIDPAGTAVVAIQVDDFEAQEIEPNQCRWEQLTEVAGQLDDLDAGLFTEALALRNFHQSHRFSPRTGEPLISTSGGWVLQERESRGSVFPRTDTAVIVLITDADDRILLGANRNWSPRRYSLLAGFVEPGESFEHAAAREVLEESGARIVDAQYVGSQPWPFPASLMVGFRARLHPDHDPNDIRPDNVEIADVRWFSRDDIAAHPEYLPGRNSIARAMIEDWYGRTIG